MEIARMRVLFSQQTPDLTTRSSGLDEIRKKTWKPPSFSTSSLVPPAYCKASLSALHKCNTHTMKKTENNNHSFRPSIECHCFVCCLTPHKCAWINSSKASPRSPVKRTVRRHRRYVIAPILTYCRIHSACLLCTGHLFWRLSSLTLILYCRMEGVQK